MFEQLAPILAEGRKLHIVLAAGSDDKIIAYIEPGKAKDDEDATFVTPFRVTDTPAALDANFGAVLTEWVKSRQQVTTSLQAALEAANAEMKARADEAAKAAKERTAKKSPAAPAKPATPAVKGKPAAKPVATKTTAAAVDTPATDAAVAQDASDPAAQANPAPSADTPPVIAGAVVVGAEEPQDSLF